MPDIVSGAALTLLRLRLLAQSPALALAQRQAWRTLAAILSATDVDSIIDTGKLTASAGATLAEGVAAFIETGYAPRWRASLLAGSSAVDAGGFSLLTPGRVASWIEREGARLIVDQTEAQRLAVRALLIDSREGDRATLRAAVRSVVGLTERQARSLASLSNALLEEGISADDRRRALQAAASRASKIRGERIARTELAFAFNGGIDEAIAEGASRGLFEEATKTWRQQPSGRSSCDVCGPLNGETVAADSLFLDKYRTPPAHPNCRCVVTYSVK